MKRTWISMVCLLSFLLISIAGNAQLLKIKAAPANSHYQIELYYANSILTLTNHANKPLSLNHAILRFQTNGRVSQVTAENKNVSTELSVTDMTHISHQLGNLYVVTLKEIQPAPLAPGKSITFSIANETKSPLKNFEFLVAPTKIKVKTTTAKAGWEQSIYICNTTANPIPLKNLEFTFTYTLPMPTTIWGAPWAGWRVVSQINNVVVLAGGTPYTPDLPSDPHCMRPLSIQFSAPFDSPKPQSPFTFKADMDPSPGNQFGNLTINLPAAPTGGLANPTITVTGNGNKQVAWGSSWNLLNLNPGSYTISSTQVSNGSQTYTADPVTAVVKVNETTTQSLVYKPVVAQGQGTISITMPVAPEAGMANPTITVSGNGTQYSRILPWNAKCKLEALAAGVYTITASDVTINGKTYKAATVNVTVEDGKTVSYTAAYQLSIAERDHVA